MYDVERGEVNTGEMIFARWSENHNNPDSNKNRTKDHLLSQLNEYVYFFPSINTKSNTKYDTFFCSYL